MGATGLILKGVRLYSRPYLIPSLTETKHLPINYHTMGMLSASISISKFGISGDVLIIMLRPNKATP